MTILSNEDRRKRADAYDAARKTTEPMFMTAADLPRHNQVLSARANLQTALGQIGRHETFLIQHPNSNSGWDAYTRLYDQIESYAKIIVALDSTTVDIPVRLEREAAPAMRTVDWLDIELPSDKIAQPDWNLTPESRARHSEQIRQENARATDLAFRKATGQG